MTTPERAALYLAQYKQDADRVPFVVYNPKGVDPETLPRIFGFNNGGYTDWLDARAIAEDGTPLAAHVCSHEGYMPGDLGLLEGYSPGNQEKYRAHYPDGFRTEFVSYHAVRDHEALQEAFRRHAAKAKES